MVLLCCAPRQRRLQPRQSRKVSFMPCSCALPQRRAGFSLLGFLKTPYGMMIGFMVFSM